jgi:hypothetical protein
MRDVLGTKMMLARILTIASMVGVAVSGLSWTCHAMEPMVSHDPLHSFVVNVGDRVFFDPNSTTLSQFAMDTLRRESSFARQYHLGTSKNLSSSWARFDSLVLTF